MGNFNKTVFLCLLLCFGMNTFAQKESFRFGVKAGVNLSSAFVDDASGTKLKTGYHLGVTLEYMLPKNFLIQSGLFFSAKGSKIEDLNGSDYIGGTPDFTHTFNEQYLELPIYGGYKIKVSNDLNIILGVGPYFGYGIGGKSKQKLNSGSWSGGITEISWKTFGDGVYDEDRDWLHGETLQRFDFGAGANVDFEYQKFVLSIGYDCSIINIANNRGYQDLKYRNNNIKASIGYKF